MVKCFWSLVLGFEERKQNLNSIVGTLKYILKKLPNLLGSW